MPNAELAYRVLDLAMAHPEHFDMDKWGGGRSGRAIRLGDLTDPGPACGTVACLAGWTVAMAGHAVDRYGIVYDEKGEELGSAQYMAAQMLGIGDEDSDMLFYSSDAEVKDRVEEIFGPRPQTA